MIMSEPLELQAQRPYALDQLTMLQSQIMQTIQGMVVLRARIEKQRRSNIEAARDTYTELDRARGRLIEQLSKSELFLLEMEEYPLAAAADQLRRGLAGFNLMSMGYKPIYEALARFTASFPTGQKTNAAIVGRLMNNIKLGYYPTDPDHISLILRGIRFPEGVTTNLFDPCCGCGKALRQLAQGNNCYAYGVELDESRAEEAQTRLHRVGFGSFFHSRISHEAFHLLFLNPPYDVVKSTGEVKDTFKFTYGGRRYDRLSLSEKIRAGMEVSELMKRLTGRNYPTFVDNMESVDDLANVRPTGQVIMAKCVSNAPLQVRPLKPIVCVEQQAA